MEKRGRTEIKQKNLFMFSGLQLGEGRFGQEPKLSPPREQKSGVFKDRRNVCMWCLHGSLIGCGG